MKIKFEDKWAIGIFNVLPKKEVSLDEVIENYRFSGVQSMKLKLI